MVYNFPLEESPFKNFPGLALTVWHNDCHLLSFVKSVVGCSRHCHTKMKRYRQLQTQLQERSSTIENKQLRIEELEQNQKVHINMHLDLVKFCRTTKVLQRFIISVCQLNGWCTYCVQVKHIPCCRFRVWQAAADEKEGQQSELNDRIQEMERQAGEQRLQLQEKVTMLENKLAEKDSSSGDLLQQINKLEQSLNEKDQTASDLDLKVKNYKRQLERLNEQLSERTNEFEEMRKRANAQEKENESRIDELERKVKSAENSLEEVTTEKDSSKDACLRREKEIEELNKKFGQLKEEAKSRIKELKALGEQRDEEHKEQVSRNEETLKRIHTEFQLEREQILLDHQAELKVRRLITCT